jgi:cytochrome c-type protein NapB
MKQSIHVSWILAACLALGADQGLADIASLRGAQEVPVTTSAPEELRYKRDKENIPRTFEEQPPLVPHLNEKYTINLKENKCLDCHVKQPGKDEARSVPVPESHYVDRQGNKLDHPAASRHFCTQCHVPQVDAKPLVESRFQSVSARP